MTDFNRRLAISLGWIGALAPTSLFAQPKGKRPLTEGPRVSADPSVIDSGLSGRWSAAMSHDMGWAATYDRVESGTILEQLEQGQTDVGLFLQHPKADSLDKQGLIYERHTIASTDVLLIGPSSDPAGIHNESDAGRALSQIIAAAGAGRANWQAPPANSALAALADSLTNGLASRGLSGSAGGKPASGPAYRLVTRASLSKAPAVAGAKVWPINDPRMKLSLQAALSFRSRHAAGKLMVTWLQWPMAQGIVGKSQPNWNRVKV